MKKIAFIGLYTFCLPLFLFSSVPRLTEDSVEFLKEFYSEDGQDEYVFNQFFKDKKEGFYIDIGAHAGIKNSNTYFFEKLGWKGICFEPDPRTFKKLVKDRNCTSYNCAVGSKERIENFIQHPCTYVSGLNRTYEDQHRRCWGVPKGSTEYLIKVQVVKLNDILDNHGIDHIDFLSIDTEGAEKDIISAIDFDHIYIDVIVLENKYKDPFFQSFLKEKGFQYMTRLHRDEVYVNKRSR